MLVRDIKFKCSFQDLLGLISETILEDNLRSFIKIIFRNVDNLNHPDLFQTAAIN